MTTTNIAYGHKCESCEIWILLLIHSFLSLSPQISLIIQIINDFFQLISTLMLSHLFDFTVMKLCEMATYNGSYRVILSHVRTAPVHSMSLSRLLLTLVKLINQRQRRHKHDCLMVIYHLPNHTHTHCVRTWNMYGWISSESILIATIATMAPQIN